MLTDIVQAGLKKSGRLDKLKAKCEQEPSSVAFQDMLGLAAECCRDQQCSRFMQKMLIEIDNGDCSQRASLGKQAVYDEVIDFDREIFLSAAKAHGDDEQTSLLNSALMNDPFGNYVI